MRAVILTDDRPNLAVTTLDDPVPGVGEVLLRVTGCGICGSDLHVASQMAPPGMVLGHEIAGTIEELGPSVDADRWKPGTVVAARPFAGCGHCAQCVRGRADHCMEFALVGMARPGGFAELTTVRADELFALPASIPAIEQALVEPLAIARRAVRRAALVPTDTVAILGAGPIGLAIAAWVRHLGVERILVSDPAPIRRDLAGRLGASTILDPSAGPIEPGVFEAFGWDGPTVVFECTGRPGLIRQAMDLTVVEGRVVVVGVCLQDDVTFPYTGLNKELDVRYSLYYGREDYTATIDALDAHALDAAGMVTETVDLEQLPERFARLRTDTDGGKIVLQP
ncbi:MAG: alcohol dehydrogenase [Acidimicrobiales bacterium]|nr:alcohol dehydrogenase [Acidimicrobiales bacterium]